MVMEEVELCFPHLNTSCWKTKRPHSHTLLISTVLSLISLLTVTLNLLVIVSISHFKLSHYIYEASDISKRCLCVCSVSDLSSEVTTGVSLSFLSRQLHTPTNLLLLSLAISDFSVGFLWLFQIMLIDGSWLLGDLMCIMYYGLDFLITSTSIGIMVLISVDRYVAICDPLHYCSKITPRRVGVCSLLCWICSLGFLCVLMKDKVKQPSRYISCVGECVIVITFIDHVSGLVFSFAVPFTVIIALYIKVFLVAVTQARVLRSHVAAVSLQRSANMKSETKAARSLGVVITVFLLCICPYFCVVLTGQDNLLNASSAAFIICLVYFNSCLNPMIYAFLYPWFRKSVRIIVTLQILKPGSCDTNLS